VSQQQQESVIVGNEIVTQPVEQQQVAGQQEKEDLAAPIVQQKQAQQNQALQELNNTMLQISQKHYTDVVNDLKEGVLRLEFVNSKGKMEVDRREYVPMTIGMNKKVMKAGKRLRLLEADIKGLGKDGALDAGKLQVKYPDILVDKDVDQEDLTDPQSWNEIKLNYIFAEKAKIYWGITNIDSYSLHDIMIVATLFESRNTFSPSSSSTPTDK
jgi:hypothetical protein